MDTKRERGSGGMNWEIGTDIYALLTPCSKWIMNEKLLYRMGNSTQCSLATWMGRKSKKKINVNI